MKIYEDNKAYIDAKTQAIITDWSTGAYFNSGMDTGNIEEVFLKNASRKDKAKNYKSDINNNVDMIHMLRLIKV